MYTIDRILAVCQSFFRSHRRALGKWAWPHFGGLVLAIGMATEHSIERLSVLLRDHTHRTDDGEYLWRSVWDESWVLREMALDTLKRLHRKEVTALATMQAQLVINVEDVRAVETRLKVIQIETQS